MSKDVNQSLYDTLYRTLGELGKVFDRYPDSDEPYPYIQLGMIQIIPRVTKSYWLGLADVTVDVWGGWEDRKKVSDIANQILVSSNRMDTLETGHDVSLEACSVEMMIDQSTATDLWRGHVLLEFIIH